MRRIFRTRRPTNFKLGRRTEPRFAKVTILILLLRINPSATNKNIQQHEASRGLSAIAELLVHASTRHVSTRIQLAYETYHTRILFRKIRKVR